jgi:hypothetical protein
VEERSLQGRPWDGARAEVKAAIDEQLARQAAGIAPHLGRTQQGRGGVEAGHVEFDLEREQGHA